MAKVVAVTGGKGGTGKTLISVNLAHIFSEKGRTLLVDVDVDNPCTKTFFKKTPISRKTVKEFRPEIDEAACKLCGICVQKCYGHALLLIPGRKLVLLPSLCEGCAICRLVCPFNAINDSWVDSGYIEEYVVNDGLDAVVGELSPATRRTPVMILKTLKRMEEKMDGYRYVVIDSPPGTGSGIYGVMDYADLIISVTEPTRLGLSDLMKIYKLYGKLKPEKRIIAVINKVGLRGEIRREIEDFLNRSGIPWRVIPYDGSVVKSYARESILVNEYPDSPSAKAIREIAAEVLKILG